MGGRYQGTCLPFLCARQGAVAIGCKSRIHPDNGKC